VRRIGKINRRRGLPHEMTVAIDEHHRQRVVRQHLLCDFRDARKHHADIENVRDGPEQLGARLDLG
jgi:hypothetical protein